MKRLAGLLLVVAGVVGLSMSHSLLAKAPTAGEKVKVCHQAEDDDGNTVWFVIEVNPNGLNGHCNHGDYTSGTVTDAEGNVVETIDLDDKDKKSDCTPPTPPDGGEWNPVCE